MPSENSSKEQHSTQNSNRDVHESSSNSDPNAEGTSLIKKRNAQNKIKGGPRSQVYMKIELPLLTDSDKGTGKRNEMVVYNATPVDNGDGDGENGNGSKGEETYSYNCLLQDLGWSGVAYTWDNP